MSVKKLPTEVSFEKYIKDIQAAHKMRGEYLAFIYDELKKTYGKQIAKEVLSKAIYEYGKYRGKRAIKKNSKLKSGKLQESVNKKRKKIMHNAIFLEDTSQRIVYRLRDCFILDALKELGKTKEEISDICDIAETIGEGKAAVYMDKLGINHYWESRVCHGDSYCDHVWTKIQKK